MFYLRCCIVLYNINEEQNDFMYPAFICTCFQFYFEEKANVLIVKSRLSSALLLIDVKYTKNYKNLMQF